MATHMVAAAQRTFRELHGVVVSAGLMQKTVKVRVGGRQWVAQVQKNFHKPQSYLVHDPNDSLRTGDVVAITPGWRTSRNKRHVVKRIIAPAQVPVEERPPVPTEAERWAAALAEARQRGPGRGASPPGGGGSSSSSTRTECGPLRTYANGK
ncbi:ribosomal protein s17 [Niveomyces insectorum RCEF 264]|uniref:Ribosomal protein s17 n=1 Tax=Niveomyces insectorum RCEF 264 TaxID=1081102 RepID=A0A167MLZ3_9HYPO|nr:ribosomal protein s17 [Niveomyces insectorum RCEF 264]